tara:strand:+ start:109 stop:492 length:384 start_codon:yes stop_codon:yes gene_type:complete
MRKYLPNMGELVDRLSILQIREVLDPKNKDSYKDQIDNIEEDLETGYLLDSQLVRAIVVLSQINLHIWMNESGAREGEGGLNNLRLTHGLNGIRNQAKNKLNSISGEDTEQKVECTAAEFKDWEISW